MTQNKLIWEIDFLSGSQISGLFPGVFSFDHKSFMRLRSLNSGPGFKNVFPFIWVIISSKHLFICLYIYSFLMLFHRRRGSSFHSPHHILTRLFSPHIITIIHPSSAVTNPTFCCQMHHGVLSADNGRKSSILLSR